MNAPSHWVIGVAGVERAEDARLRDPARVAEPLKLSIDLPAQTAMEQVLAEAMERLDAKGAVGILMEADTGKIRVLASLPDFDPNMRPPLPTSGDPADSPLFNRAAQRRYELGSTFKILGVAQGLERGAITPKTLMAGSSVLYFTENPVIDGEAYCEGAVVDTVNFRDLLENHPDLNEIWVIRITERKQT